jgi:uncharacterized membrane protein YhaH (DUF805 family)
VLSGAMMFIFESAFQTLRKYADFNGRASRQEFWCFFAFVIIANALANFIGRLLGMWGSFSGLVAVLLIIPQLAVAVRRLHDVGKPGRELVVPCVMLFAAPILFRFGGFLPKIVALGFFAITLLAFANLLSLLAKKGTSVPNRYGSAPTAFSFAR